MTGMSGISLLWEARYTTKCRAPTDQSPKMVSSRFMEEILVPYLNESLAAKVDSVPWRPVARATRCHGGMSFRLLEGFAYLSQETPAVSC
jgi:hypothetical protein